MSILNLDYWDLALAALLMLLSAAISLALSLKLEKKLLIATLRTVIQLSLIGLVLKWLFSYQTWYFVLPIIMVMTLIAAQTASSKSRHRYRGAFWDSLLAITTASWSITAIGIFIILSVKPWYTPQYIIPILGLVLGNTLTAVSLTIERYTSELRDHQHRIDLYLSLGATAWEASRDCTRYALSAGMLPTINAMTVVGLVSLPGMMTGQILAGSPPQQAVNYQILTMFLIAAATALSCLGIILLTFQRLFSRDHCFLSQHLTLNNAKR